MANILILSPRVWLVFDSNIEYNLQSYIQLPVLSTHWLKSDHCKAIKPFDHISRSIDTLVKTEMCHHRKVRSRQMKPCWKCTPPLHSRGTGSPRCGRVQSFSWNISSVCCIAAKQEEGLIFHTVFAYLLLFDEQILDFLMTGLNNNHFSWNALWLTAKLSCIQRQSKQWRVGTNRERKNMTRQH